MRTVDIAIVGGGLAGSAAAIMLGRADCDVALIDPQAEARPDFRCEKLDPSQMRLFRSMGLSGLVLPRATPNRTLWVARCGKVVDRMPIEQHGILYHDLVRAMREGIPDRVEQICDSVVSLATSHDRQIVALRDGSAIDARLVVLANGLNRSLQQELGLTYTALSSFHSTAIGFGIEPRRGEDLPFESLTFFGASPADRTAYLTLFRLGSRLRANLMTYREPKDPWLHAIRDEPRATLLELMPALSTLLGEFDIQGPVQMRPTNLYAVKDPVRSGVVLVGDAFATSCPAAGTGTNKVLRDVQRLCGTHIPGWLSSEGMEAAKIETFYADPHKRAEDAHSERAAFRLKTITLAPGLFGEARRHARFFGRFAKGAARRVTGRFVGSDPEWTDGATRSRDAGQDAVETTAPLRVETHTETGRLENEWLALEAACPDVTIFQTHGWCCAWIDAAQAAGRPESIRLATVWRGGRLVLLWPLSVRRLAGSRIVHALAEPATQYADVLIDPGEDRAELIALVWAEMLAWRGIDAIELRRVRDGSALAQLPGLASHAVVHSRTFAPILDFRRLSVESGAATRTSRTRNSLRRHMRALGRGGTVAFELCDRIADQRSLVREAFAMKREWQKARALPSAGFAHSASEDCLLRLAEKGHLWVTRLRVGEETAAIEIGAVRSGRYWSLVQSYQLQFAKHSPGRLLLWHFLEVCPNLSIDIFDFLGPDCDHKREWSNDEMGICDYLVPLSLQGRAATSYLSEVKPRLKDIHTRLPAGVRRLTAHLAGQLS